MSSRLPIVAVVCICICIIGNLLSCIHVVQASYTVEKAALVPGIIQWNTPSFKSLDSVLVEQNKTARLRITVNMPWLNAMTIITRDNIDQIARTNLAGNFIRVDKPWRQLWKMNSSLDIGVPSGLENYKCSTLVQVLAEFGKPGTFNTTYDLVETSAFDRNQWAYRTYNNVVRVYPGSTTGIEITSQLWISIPIDIALDDEWIKACRPWVEIFPDAAGKNWFLINVAAHAWTPPRNVWYPGPSLDNNTTLLILPDATADLLLQDASSSFGVASILPSMEIRIGLYLAYSDDLQLTTREDYQLQVSKFELWAALETCYDNSNLAETEETFRIRIEWANYALSNYPGPIVSLDSYGIRYNASGTDCLSITEKPLCIKSDCHTQEQWHIMNDVTTPSITLSKPFVLRIQDLDSHVVLQIQFAIATLDTNSWIYSASILGILSFSVVCLVCCGIGYESLENHCIARKEALQERELVSSPNHEPIDDADTIDTRRDISQRIDQKQSRRKKLKTAQVSDTRHGTRTFSQTRPKTPIKREDEEEEMESSASESSTHSSDSE